MYEVTIDSLLFVPPQGLTHLGKGTLTLCPYHSDRQLMSQVAVAGLLTVLVSFLDVKNSEFILLLLPSLPYTLTLSTSLFVIIHQWFPSVNILPGVHCVHYSNPGEISLHSLRPGSRHAATHAGHLR